MKKIIAASFVLLLILTSKGSADSEAQLCSELSGYFVGGQKSKLENPSRDTTKEEDLLIDKMKIELLEQDSVNKGVFIVDADNDGKEDAFVWVVQGSLRLVNAELYDIPAKQVSNESKLVLKAELYSLGALFEPRFVRFKGVNYLVAHEAGDIDGPIYLSKIAKAANGQYQQRTLCRMQTTLRAETKCRHPACKKLVEVIENKAGNKPFVDIYWPHKYASPSGLSVYYSEDWKHGDFDNTKNSTSLWQIGTKKEVLSESEQNRLKRTLAQQSEVLSNQLHKPISLPSQWEFFLFKAHGNRTYWAWDFGMPPYGEEIHITYTNAKKSDYIGMIRIKSSVVLGPCSSDCVTSLDPTQ